MKIVLTVFIAVSILATNGVQAESLLEWHLDACDYASANPDADACYQAGELYEKTKAKQDYLEAFKYFEKACDHYHPGGCFKLGDYFSQGKVVKQDYQKALKYYKKACEGGNGKGCYVIGDYYSQGKVVKKDYQKALKYYKAACDVGFTKGCPGAKTSYTENIDLNEKLKALGTACDDNNDAASCGRVGLMHLKIWDTDSEQTNEYFQIALEYIQKGCDLGDADSCHNLAVIFDHKAPMIIATERDIKKVVKYRQKACDLNSAVDCYIIAKMYREGSYGIMRPYYKKSLKFYKKSCDLGNAGGCYAVSSMLLREFRKQDRKAEARKFFQKGVSYLIKKCDNGDGESCYNASIMFGKGVFMGDFSNDEKEIKFLIKACNLKITKACTDCRAANCWGQN